MTEAIIVGAVALAIGILLGKLIFAKNTQRKIQEAEDQAKRIIAEGQLSAETLKKDKLLEAKEKYLQMKSEHEKEVLQRNQKLAESENRIKQKEQSLNQKTEQLQKQVAENESIKENLGRQIELVNIKRSELEKHQEEHIRRLEKVAALTAEEARQQLVESLKEEARSQALSHIQEIIEDAKTKANKGSQKDHHTIHPAYRCRTNHRKRHHRVQPGKR